MEDNKEIRSLAARVAAHESWAATGDRSARTAPARAALEARFLEQADGDPIRADHLRKAYYSRIALKSVQVRREKRRLAQRERELEQQEAELRQELAEHEDFGNN